MREASRSAPVLWRFPARRRSKPNKVFGNIFRRGRRTCSGGLCPPGRAQREKTALTERRYKLEIIFSRGWTRMKPGWKQPRQRAAGGFENSPAFQGWDAGHTAAKSPARDERMILPSRMGLGRFANREPSHQWLGYFQKPKRARIPLLGALGWPWQRWLELGSFAVKVGAAWCRCCRRKFARASRASPDDRPDW